MNAATPVVGLPPITIHQRVAAFGAIVRPWSIDQTGVRQIGDKRGAGATWGFVDTGYSPHPDLVANIVECRDFTGSAFGHRDIHGHGTHVLGTFCGMQRATGDGPGFANAARACVAKGLGDDGTGNDEWTANAIYWLVDECKVHGINLSLGAPTHLPLTEAAIRHSHRMGVFVVVAAGNFGDNATSWPALMDEAISVGATNKRREASRFSEPSSVDVAAPGEEILSCYLNGQYAVLSGTSMAAPWFSGMLATEIGEWIKGGRAVPSFDRVFDMIEAWTDDIGEPGDDPKTGNGLASIERYLATRKVEVPVGEAKELNLGVCKVRWPGRAGDWFSVGT